MLEKKPKSEINYQKYIIAKSAGVVRRTINYANTITVVKKLNLIRLAILTKKYFYERCVFPFFESRNLFKHARPLRHETKLFEKKINLKQNLSRVVCNKTTNFAKGVKFSLLISSLALTNRQNN